MLLLEELNHVGEVGSGLRQPFLGPCFRLAARLVHGQVGDVPIGDELAQRGGARVLGELPEGAHGDQIGGAQGDVLALIPGVRQLAGDRAPDAA